MTGSGQGRGGSVTVKNQQLHIIHWVVTKPFMFMAPIVHVLCWCQFPALIPRPRLWLAALLVLALLHFFGPGQRIGEAATPGPCPDVDDPEGILLWPEDGLPDDDPCCRPDPWADGPEEVWTPEAEVPDFVPARKFVGARCGCVFKLGKLGLGYYRDKGIDDFSAAGTGIGLRRNGPTLAVNLYDMLFGVPDSISVLVPHGRGVPVRDAGNGRAGVGGPCLTNGSS